MTIPAGVDRVEITFHGRKGDPVRIDEPCDKVSRVRIVGEGGPVDRRCLETAVRGALRVRTSPAARPRRRPSAQPTRSTPPPARQRRRQGARRNYAAGERTRLAKVVAPHHGRVQVRPTSPGQVLVAGPCTDAPVLNIWTWHQEYVLSPKAVYLEAGAPVANELGEMSPTAEPLVPQAGQRVILLPAENRSAPAHQNPLGARHARRRGRGGGLPSGPHTKRSASGSRPRAHHWVTAAVNGRLESSLDAVAGAHGA